MLSWVKNIQSLQFFYIIIVLGAEISFQKRVVCQEIYIIFSKIKFFPLEYCYCFVVTASALPETTSIYG